MATIFGWDASDFDWDRGPMDLAAARAAGIDFFTHKATEATSTRHKHYGEALNRARAAGIPFLGAYHVVRSSPSVANQVDYLLKYANEVTSWWPEHPGWFWQCDLEKWSYDSVPPARGVDFCVALAKKTNRAVLLYAPKWAYADSIGGQAPLWASSYVSGAGQFKALYPGNASSRWGAYSGRTPVILQYSSSATIGRQPTCDANAFRGTIAEFAALIGAGTDHVEGIVSDYDPYGAPASVGNREPGVLSADLWGQEMAGVSPYDGKTASFRTKQLQRIEEMLGQLQAPTFPQESINAAVKAALQDPSVVAGLVKAVNDDAAKRAAE